MNDIFRALFRALASQLHPRMLWLAIWPFLLALLVWGGFAWWLREEAFAVLNALLASLTVVGWMDAALGSMGMSGFKAFLAPLVYLGLLIPTIVVSALLIIALLAMPAVIEHVSSRGYSDVARRPDGGVIGPWLTSALNALAATLIFIVGWLATMPLWLIAPLALILPLLWWSWLTTRILRVDALIEHASEAERAILLKKHGRSFFLLGLLVSLMNFIPPLFFFAPIFSGLAFTHFGLHALRQLRAQDSAAPVALRAAIDMGEVDIVTEPIALPGRPSAPPPSHPPTIPGSPS